MKRISVSLLALTAATATSHAQRDLREIPSTDPAVQQATFQLPTELQANLFAQDPMIAKPIQMAWDEKGRLWCASSAIYPHIKPGQEQSDKIVVLEDTDHDGKADKSTVFYEGLLIPTGILPGDGGAYIANSTELLFMKDTNGDGRADTSEVIMSGFGTEDTHHILHSIKRGHDGCLYFNQSVYIHTHTETPYGVRRLMGSGIWQYRSETKRAEIFAMGHVNPWGHVWDQWGQSFVTDGAYGEGINHSFPGATFICLPNQLPRILRGLNPGQPKHCGLEIISGRHFPADWQGDLITCDFRGHRVNRFKVTPNGSSFTSQQLPDVVTSNHGSFRPIDLKMGPDGALYIADWYNPIIQHGEVDFRDERRDHVHGRIWRISVKNSPLCPAIDYAAKSTDELIALLREPEQWVRLEAKQTLKTRPHEEVIEALKKAFATHQNDAAMVREITWTMQTIADFDLKWPFDRDLLQSLLQKDGDSRSVAARVLGFVLRDGKGAEALTMTSPLATDPSAKVRLEAINALRMANSAAAVEAACRALDHPMDENIDFSLWLTCRQLADTWLPAFQKGEITFGGNVAQIAFALKAADRPQAVAALLDLVSADKVNADRLRDVVALVGSLGSPDDLAKLTSLTAKVPGDAIASALVTAARQRKVLIDPATVTPLASAGGDQASPASLRLAGAYKLDGLRSHLESFASQGGALADAALESLVALGGDASRSFLSKLSNDASADLRGQAIAALFAMDPAAAAPMTPAFLAALTSPDPASRLFEAALARKDGPAILAGALKDQKIPSEIAAAGIQKASSAGGDTKALVEVLTAAGNLQPVMSLSPEELTKMMAEVKTSGDPARGEVVYRRAAQQCQVCHAIGAVGGIVGPDLVSIGSSAPVDYIIESLLEPSKKIKEGYATTMISTKDGGVHSGFLVRQDDREVLLRDAAGHVESIPASTVAKQEAIPVSLMPPGLTASLRRDEFIDLVRFLSELGKDGPYKVQEDGAVRRWRTAQPLPDMGRWVSLKGIRGFAEHQADLVWMPVYSRTNGTLPISEATAFKAGSKSQAVLQAEIEVSTAGKVGLRLNDTTGLQIFAGNSPVNAATEMTVDLPAGRSLITVHIDTAARRDPLRLATFRPDGSPATARPVGGP